MSNVEIKSETVETEEREENPKENTASLRRLAAFAFALSPVGKTFLPSFGLDSST